MTGSQAFEELNQYGVLDYLAENYEILHTQSYQWILEEATAAITPQERVAFDLNFDISERIYQIIKEKGMTKRDLARLTGKKESEVSRWFMLGHNFTCKTIALIQLALGEKIVEVVK